MSFLGKILRFWEENNTLPPIREGREGKKVIEKKMDDDVRSDGKVSMYFGIGFFFFYSCSYLVVVIIIFTLLCCLAVTKDNE